MALKNIIIDISQKNHITIPSVHCDSNVRFVNIKIANNNKRIDVISSDNPILTFGSGITKYFRE